MTDGKTYFAKWLHKQMGTRHQWSNVSKVFLLRKSGKILISYCRPLYKRKVKEKEEKSRKKNQGEYSRNRPILRIVLYRWPWPRVSSSHIFECPFFILAPLRKRALRLKIYTEWFIKWPLSHYISKFAFDTYCAAWYCLPYKAK